MNLSDEEIVFCDEYIKNKFNLKETTKALSMKINHANNLLKDKYVKKYINDRRDTIISKTNVSLEELTNILWKSLKECYEAKDFKGLKGMSQEICHIMGYYKPIKTENTMTIIEDSIKRLHVTVNQIKEI